MHLSTPSTTHLLPSIGKVLLSTSQSYLDEKEIELCKENHQTDLVCISLEISFVSTMETCQVIFEQTKTQFTNQKFEPKKILKTSFYRNLSKEISEYSLTHIDLKPSSLNHYNVNTESFIFGKLNTQSFLQLHVFVNRSLIKKFPLDIYFEDCFPIWRLVPGEKYLLKNKSNKDITIQFLEFKSMSFPKPKL